MEELEFLRKFENFTSQNLANLIGGSITHTGEKLTIVYIASIKIYQVLLSDK